MINLDSTEVHSRTLPAIFDTKAAADKAVNRLAASSWLTFICAAMMLMIRSFAASASVPRQRRAGCPLTLC